MEVKELRIGNYVDLYGTIATVGRFDFNDRAPRGLAIDKGMPIKLTEEWLIKLGFEITRLAFADRYIKYDECIFYIRSDNEWYHKSHKATYIKYVHQLQNLFFALTGEELTCQK